MAALLPLLFCIGEPEEGIDEGQYVREIIPQTLDKGVHADDIRTLRKLAKDMNQEMIKDKERLVGHRGFAAHIVHDQVFLETVRILGILPYAQLEEVKAQQNKCSAAKSLIKLLRACRPSRRVLYAWALIQFNQDHHLKSIEEGVKSRLKLFSKDQIKRLVQLMENEEPVDQESFPRQTRKTPKRSHMPDPMADPLHNLSEEKACRIRELDKAWSKWATPQKGRVLDGCGWYRVDQDVKLQSMAIRCGKGVCIQVYYKATIQLMTKDGQDPPLPEDLLNLLLPVLPDIPERITPVKSYADITIINRGRYRATVEYTSITHTHPPSESNFWRNVALVTLEVVVIGGVVVLMVYWFPAAAATAASAAVAAKDWVTSWFSWAQ